MLSSSGSTRITSSLSSPSAESGYISFGREEETTKCLELMECLDQEEARRENRRRNRARYAFKHEEDIGESIEPSVFEILQLGPQESKLQTCRRYLIGKRWVVAEAWKQMQETILWKEQEKILDLRKEDPSDILGCPEEQFLSHFPMWYAHNAAHASLASSYEHVLMDKQDHPVIVYNVGKFNIKAMHSITDMQKLNRYMMWRIDRGSYLLASNPKYENQENSGLHPSMKREAPMQFMVVINLEGFTLWQHFNRTTMTWVNTLNSIGSNYYTETLFKMIVINVPSYFQSAWAVVQPLINADTQTKITLVPQTEDAAEKLGEYMTEETVNHVLHPKGIRSPDQLET